MTEEQFGVLAALLKSRSGLMLARDQGYLVEARLGALARRAGLADSGALIEMLAHAGPADALAIRVVEAMTTNETLFFRDTKPFTHLRDVALPRILAGRAAGARLRIWSAACSSGQEAYSIAMTLADLPLAGRGVEIIGTDIAREPLAQARAGHYSQFEVQRGLPMQTLVRHFTKYGAGWRISEGLRAMARFQHWNLLADLHPLGRFDIVFCRNVLIYLDSPTKARVLEAIARQMAPDGFLYLGGAETVIGITECFAPLPGERGVYGLAGATAAMKAR